jgi:hypothetical protein
VVLPASALALAASRQLVEFSRVFAGLDHGVDAAFEELKAKGGGRSDTNERFRA